MRTIGLLGGMSCESTALYYNLLNQEIRKRLGGLHSAQVLIYSFDFTFIEDIQRSGQWEEAAEYIAQGISVLADGHADVALICSVTGQRDWDYITHRASIPLICARTVVCDALKRSSACKVGLLGTRYTMEQPYFADMLREVGSDVVIPDSISRERIQSIIYDELCRGIKREESKSFLTNILNEWKEAGVDAAVLGCTELPLVLTNETSPLPLVDVVQLHVEAALDYALQMA